MRTTPFRAVVAAVLTVSLATGPLLAQGAPKGPKGPKGASTAAAAVDAGPPAVDAGPAVDPNAPKPLTDSLTGEAKADYDSGKLLFADGDFAGALVKFRTSQEKSHDARLNWNMAACEKNLRHYAKVLTLLNSYLADGGALLTDQDKLDAKELIAAISPFTATLKLTVNEPDADVFVDDEPLGKSPLAKPPLVDIGTRHIKVTKDGFKEHASTVVVGGAEIAVDVKLDKIVHEGRLIVTARSADSIYVDGKLVGAGRFDSRLPSGVHTLRVTATGMRPHEAEINIQDEQTNNSAITLEAEQKPAAAGLPAWVWITGGVVLAAGAGIGGYFLFKPSDQASTPVSGTLDPGTVRLPSFRY